MVVQNGDEPHGTIRKKSPTIQQIQVNRRTPTTITTLRECRERYTNPKTKIESKNGPLEKKLRIWNPIILRFYIFGLPPTQDASHK